MLNKLKHIKGMEKYVSIIKDFYRSMRFRVFIAVILVGIIPLFMIGSLVINPIEKEMAESKINRLQKQCNIIKNHIISEDYMEAQNSETIDAELLQLSSMYDGRVMLIDRNFIIIKDTYNIDINKTTISKDVIRCYKGNYISKYSKKSKSIKINTPIENNDGQIIGVIDAVFSTNDIESSLSDIRERITFIESMLTLLILVFTFFWVRHLVKPFDKIETQLQKTESGYLDGKLSLDGYTETRKIADSFNGILDRMHKLDESRQEFVSNVSHELKTPITSVKVLADSLLSQENVPAEIYREFFKDISAEIDRENAIISDLLTLARMDKKNASLNIEKKDINEIVEIILNRLKPIAEKNNIEFIFESHRSVVAEVDVIKISGAISNLVENAIKYNVEDGWVRVTLDADHMYFYVIVRDSGIGIPKEAQELIFERFYRVDKARARKTGGTGLGLAITRTTILLHNGDIKLSSEEGKGTTFTMRIPLNYVSEKNSTNGGKELEKDEE